MSLSAIKLLKTIPKDRILNTELNYSLYETFLVAITTPFTPTVYANAVTDGQTSEQSHLPAITNELVSLFRAHEANDNFVATIQVLFPILCLAGRLEILIEHQTGSVAAWCEFLHLCNVLLGSDNVLRPNNRSSNGIQEGIIGRLRSLSSQYLAILCASDDPTEDLRFSRNFVTRKGHNSQEAQLRTSDHGLRALDKLISVQSDEFRREIVKRVEQKLGAAVAKTSRNEITGTSVIVPLLMLQLTWDSSKNYSPNSFGNMVIIITNAEKFPETAVRLALDLFVKWFVGEQSNLSQKDIEESSTKSKCLVKMFRMTLCNSNVNRSNEILIGYDDYTDFIRSKLMSSLLMNETSSIFLSKVVEDSSLVEQQELRDWIFGKHWLHTPLNIYNTLTVPLAIYSDSISNLLSNLETLPFSSCDPNSTYQSLYRILKEVELFKDKFIADPYSRNTLEGILSNLGDYFDKALSTSSDLDTNISLCSNCHSQNVCHECILGWTLRSPLCQAACQLARVCEGISVSMSDEILMRLVFPTDYYSSQSTRVWILWLYASSHISRCLENEVVKHELTHLPYDMETCWPLLIRLNLIQMLDSSEIIQLSLPLALHVVDNYELDPTTAQQAVYLQAQKIVKRCSTKHSIKDVTVNADTITNYFRFRVEAILLNTSPDKKRISLSSSGSLLQYLSTPVLSNLGIYCLDNLTSTLIYPDINVFLEIVPFLQCIVMRISEVLLQDGIIPQTTNYCVTDLISKDGGESSDNIFKEDKPGTLERQFADRLMSFAVGLPSSFSGYLALINSSIDCCKYCLLIHTSQPRGLLSRIRQCGNGMESALKYTCFGPDLIHHCFSIIEEVFIPYAPDFSVRMIKNSLLPYVEEHLDRLPMRKVRRQSLSDRLKKFLEIAAIMDKTVPCIEDNSKQ